MFKQKWARNKKRIDKVGLMVRHLIHRMILVSMFILLNGHKLIWSLWHDHWKSSKRLLAQLIYKMNFFVFHIHLFDMSCSNLFQSPQSSSQQTINFKIKIILWHRLNIVIYCWFKFFRFILIVVSFPISTNQRWLQWQKGR